MNQAEDIDKKLKKTAGILAHEGLELSCRAKRIIRLEAGGRITGEEAIRLLKGDKRRTATAFP